MHLLPRDPAEKLNLSLNDWRYKINLQERVVGSMIKATSVRTLDSRVGGQFDHMRLTDLTFHKSSVVLLILGDDVYSIVFRSDG